ncbi:uncharacterized protein PGTG_06602 [Puccinia graminis f. sp. tritici CRL 75-36-700-3]|uniref:Uncharacterized protein n=1 Tax=Puccinia graminis f. sp. tritici (strain CRL 75-36-700-3 / race SCCL) TaxID=418459 RepID=E3K8U0_PUCGT|nr:uncharacterized protein PGTG_06602 [Puccinia graminis f. sp. tritici CRL 75-36-700-3]EFP80646.1 hypothetical protein PGTG_06602 [Puccinia graminis f. sp. tritici CRL 75-36-700-3]
MGSDHIRQAWSLRVCLLQICLVAFIGKSTCFIEVQKILGSTDDQWLGYTRARLSATQTLGTSFGLLPPKALGQRITGDRSSLFKSSGYWGQNEPESEKDLYKKFSGLIHSYFQDTIGFSIPEVEDIVHSIQNDINHLIEKAFHNEGTNKQKSKTMAIELYGVQSQQEGKEKFVPGDLSLEGSPFTQELMDFLEC